MPSLIEKYVKTGKVRIIFRDFPVPSHTSAVRAAHAAQCAADQGRYWDMHDRLFAQADRLGGTHDEDFALFRGFAQELGLDVGKYMECMESRKYLERITEDVVNARAMGITGTPTYILNGELLFGLYPSPVWETLIEARLSKFP